MQPQAAWAQLALFCAVGRVSHVSFRIRSHFCVSVSSLAQNLIICSMASSPMSHSPAAFIFQEVFIWHHLRERWGDMRGESSCSFSSSFPPVSTSSSPSSIITCIVIVTIPTVTILHRQSTRPVPGHSVFTSLNLLHNPRGSCDYPHYTDGETEA